MTEHGLGTYVDLNSSSKPILPLTCDIPSNFLTMMHINLLSYNGDNGPYFAKIEIICANGLG